MKRLLMAIFALLLGIDAFAMDAPMSTIGTKRGTTEEVEEIAPAAKEGRTEPSKNYLFSDMPEEIQERIRGYINTAPGFGLEKLYNVAQAIRTHRGLSKDEKNYMDDPTFVELLIIELARLYTNNNKTKVAVAIHTRSAADWLNQALSQEAQLLEQNLRLLDKEVTVELIDELNRNSLDSARFLINAAKIPSQNNYYLRFGYVSPRRETLLQAAARAGDINIFNAIFAHSNNLFLINQPNENGQTALMEAITYNHTPIALALIKANALPFLLDENQQISDSALLRASHNNNLEVVKALLENPQVRQNVNFVNDFYQFTPLYYAAQHNNYPMFQMLVNVPNVQLDGNILYQALAHNTQMVKDLIAQGQNVNVAADTEDGKTHAAFGVFEVSKRGNPIVDDTNTRERLLLILPGISVDQRDSSQVTLLMRAVEQAKSKTVEALLQAHADVTRVDSEGHNALWYAQQLTSLNKDRIINMLRDKAIAQEQARKKQEEEIAQKKDDDIFSVLNLEGQG